MLKDNPFCVLNIPMSADKRRIYSSVEELGLEADPSACEEAALVLVHPAKRLDAELDWFPEDDESTVRMIREAVRAGMPVPGEVESELSASGKLNTAMNGLGLRFPPGCKVKAAVLEEEVQKIDILTGRCSADDMTAGINRVRASAGITEVTAEAVKHAWEEKRQRITAELAQILDRLDLRDHVAVMSRLVESCRTGGNAFRFGSIIYDLADRYEIRMQAETEKLTEDLVNSVERTEKYARTSLDFTVYYRSFNRKFKRWKKIIAPVQAAAYARGADHQSSIAAWEKIHGIIHTAMLKSSLFEAFQLAESMKDSFAYVPSLAGRLDYDMNLVRKGIEFVVKKAPEDYVRNEKKQKAKSIWMRVIILLMVLFYAVICIIAPTDEEVAKDPGSKAYREMSLPEKRGSNGEFEQVRMPGTGFVFQDTMGDESGRVCRITVKNNDYHNNYFMRFSDRVCGDESIVEASGGDRILSFLVRIREETEITLPPGDYYISYDYGYNWYGWMHRFTSGQDPPAGLPEIKLPVMEPASDKPYTFEEGKNYTVEIQDRTTDDSIVIGE